MAKNNEHKVYDKSEVYFQDGEAKQCFCIGPENCNDIACELVKKHKEKQRGKL